MAVGIQGKNGLYIIARFQRNNGIRVPKIVEADISHAMNVFDGL